MSTPAGFGSGSIKQDPSSLAVAVRTHPAADEEREWIALTTQNGAFYASWDDVSEWLDLYVAA